MDEKKINMRYQNKKKPFRIKQKTRKPLQYVLWNITTWLPLQPLLQPVLYYYLYKYYIINIYLIHIDLYNITSNLLVKASVHPYKNCVGNRPFYSNRRATLLLHLLMFTTDLLDCTSGSWKISHFLHCTKETFPVRLKESKSGCLRKLNTLYLDLAWFSILITPGSIIHLKRFGSDMRLTTFDFVQCLRPDRE